MIKRILIALDPDQDTPIATNFALNLAKRFDASVTGLAVVDTSNIYPTGITGEPDVTHHARNLWEELTDEARRVAEDLLKSFEEQVKKAGIAYTAVRKEGASYERIIEGMKYHDILIVGKDSHFFYNEPKRDTKTLAEVVKNGVSPVLVVTNRINEMKRVLVAFDGSKPSARSLKSFVHLLPYGNDLEMELLHVRSKNSDGESALSLEYAEIFLRKHGFQKVTKTIVSGNKPSAEILKRCDETEADLIVLGAHAVSAIKRLTFGSNTHDLITKSETPLFLSP